MRFEDFLSKKSILAIRRVANADDWTFNNLVMLSGLSPKRDFRFVDLSGMDLRGADLRGFDLSGADLRGCLRDDSTKIDETTQLVDAELDWVHEPGVHIVEKMFEIERASNRAARTRAISELVTQYRSERHAHEYFRNMIRETDSIDVLFDVADYFEPKTDLDYDILSKALTKFALRSVRIRNPRSSATRSASGFSNYFSRLQESKNEYIREIILAYFERSISAGRVSINPNKYEVTDDFKRLLEVIELTPRTSDLLQSR